MSCLGVVWGLVFGAYITDAEARIRDRNELFCTIPKAAYLNDIYCHIFDTIKIQQPYSMQKLELYSYVYQELLDEQEADNVPIVGYWEDEIWYQDITNQRDTEWQDKWDTTKFILILKDEKSEEYWALQEFFDPLEIVFENSAGCIAIVN